MCEGSRASFCGAQGGGYVWRRRIAEDEEFDEGPEEEDDGELTEEEALGEGEAVGVRIAVWLEGRLTRILSGV